MLCGYVSWGGACGDRGRTMSSEFLEILNFRHFYKHFEFVLNEENELEKHLLQDIFVRVGIELVTVDM